jgi:hypothetical protein
MEDVAMPARTRFIVTLEGTAGDDANRQHIRTLRLLLKRLLRAHSLRCVEARQVDDVDPFHRNDDGGEH